MDLGKSLRVAMAQAKMPGTEVAEHMMVTPQQVAKWRNTGSIKQSNVEQLASMFGLKVSEFVALGE